MCPHRYYSTVWAGVNSGRGKGDYPRLQPLFPHAASAGAVSVVASPSFCFVPGAYLPPSGGSGYWDIVFLCQAHRNASPLRAWAQRCRPVLAVDRDRLSEEQLPCSLFQETLAHVHHSESCVVDMGGMPVPWNSTETPGPGWLRSPRTPRFKVGSTVRSAFRAGPGRCRRGRVIGGRVLCTSLWALFGAVSARRAARDVSPNAGVWPSTIPPSGQNSQSVGWYQSTKTRDFGVWQSGTDAP